MEKTKAFAEIIESSLSGWVAQSWKWDEFPTFGSLVMIKEAQRSYFGIVHQMQTGSMEAGRYPFPYQKTHQELLEEQPQIFEFLKTTFSCITIGYYERGSIFYLLAPEPPKIHSFVQPVPIDMVKQFFYHTTYLQILFGLSSQIFNLDELLLAILHNQARLGIITERKIQLFMHTFSLLTDNDYRRLKLFLQRAQPIIDSALTATTSKDLISKDVISQKSSEIFD